MLKKEEIICFNNLHSFSSNAARIHYTSRLYIIRDYRLSYQLRLPTTTKTNEK